MQSKRNITQNERWREDVCRLHADSSKTFSEHIETSVTRTILLQLGITRTVKTNH